MLETTNSLQRLSDFTGIKKNQILEVLNAKNIHPVEIEGNSKSVHYKLADFQQALQGLIPLEKPKYQVIPIVNRKGGVGKTTIATMLSIGLSTAGYKVLCIDFDSQRNITMTFLPRDRQPNDLTSAKFLNREISIEDAVIKVLPNLDFIECTKYSQTLTNIVTNHNHGIDLIRFLFEDIGIRDMYDFIIIDCAPSESPFQNAILKASDLVISPTEAHQFSLDGVISVKETVEEIVKRDRRDIQMRIMANRFEQANKFHTVSLQSIAEAYGDILYALPMKKINGISNSTNYSELDYTLDPTTYTTYREICTLVMNDAVHGEFMSMAKSEIGMNFKNKLDDKVNKIYGEGEVTV